ncbi:hypothetical protein FJY90_01725 [Candidatus Gottesmanbacteria bacterium]|nr:hypothetical protein [Candidatus Gottesmanbacteria bacterium]
MMDILEITNQIQWNTDLSSLANRAQYGLNLARRGKYGPKTIEHLSAGIRFCELVRDGAAVVASGKITSDQLGVARVFSVLEDSGVRPKEVKEKVEIVLMLLEAIKNMEKVSDREIDESKDFLGKLSDPYQKAAHGALSFLRQQEGLY